MGYSRGDRVRVKGYQGRVGILRVWEEKPRGLVLCSESGYRLLNAGEDAPLVGFPTEDIQGLEGAISEGSSIGE